MSSIISYVYDFIFIGIGLYLVYNSYQNGIVYTIFNILKYIVVFFLSKFLITTFSSVIYSISEYIHGSFSSIPIEFFTNIVNFVMFIIIFILLKFIFGMFLGFFKTLVRIPIIGPINKIVGGAFGIIYSAVFISFLCFLIKFIITITDNSLLYLNLDIINSTFFIKIFYNFNFFML